MSAVFKGDATAVIRGRGLILAGWVIEGVVRKGMRISVEGFPRGLQIDGLEMITSDSPSADLVGLFFQSTDEFETKLWKQLKVKDELYELLEPSPDP